jgi:hypothetical protein
MAPCRSKEQREMEKEASRQAGGKEKKEPSLVIVRWRVCSERRSRSSKRKVCLQSKDYSISAFSGLVSK